MSKQITLDNQIYKFDISLLPCLINGHEKSGASYFSIALITQLIQAGHKVLFFTAFPMAKEELLKQIGNNKAIEINKHTDIKSIPTDNSLIIESGNISLLKQIIHHIPNIKSYIIFIKNIEQYDQHVVEIAKNIDNIVISGDYDQCISKQELKSKERNSIITFTQPNFEEYSHIPPLQKYESYLISKQDKGIIRLSLD